MCLGRRTMVQMTATAGKNNSRGFLTPENRQKPEPTQVKSRLTRCNTVSHAPNALPQGNLNEDAPRLDVILSMRLLCSALLSVCLAHAATATFDQAVRPLLTQTCAACH